MKKTISLILIFLLICALLPLGFSPEADAYGGNIVSVSTLEELRAAVNKDSAHVVLAGDITGEGDPDLLKINGNGVLLDLNRHTLKNTNPGSTTRSSYTIRVNSSDVRITNGTIYGSGVHCHGIRTDQYSGDVEIDKIETSGDLDRIIDGYAAVEVPIHIFIPLSVTLLTMLSRSEKS